MSDTSKVQILIRPEAAWGEDPVNKAYTELLINSESLTPGKQTVKSAAIRSDRQKDAIIKVGESASGSITANMSEAFLDAFGACLFQAAKVTGSKTATATAATQLLTFATEDDYLAVAGGNVVLISGGTTPANNGRKLVVGRSLANKTLTLAAGSLTADEAAVTVAVSYYRNGNISPIPSVAIQKGFQDAVDNGYHVLNGLRVNTASFNFNARAIATCEMAVLGKQYQIFEDSQASAVTPYAPDAPISTSADFGSVKDGGVELVDLLSEWTMQINNNMRERPAIGTVFSADHGTGDFVVTGSIKAYFSSGAMLEKCLAHNTAAISVSATAGGKLMLVSLPKVHLLTDEVPIPGENQDVMENISYEALRDPTLGYTLQIDLI